ncbi:MAG: leucyl aminopeptidase, partial [Oscillospiraceae bacterium]
SAALAEPVLIIMPPRDTDGEEPPKSVAAAMKESDAFVCVVGKSITHTHAVKDACENGSRGIMLTQFSEDMMIHGGLEADFPKAARDCKAIAQHLGGAELVHLTTHGGTNLTFSAKGRRHNAMYCMVKKGEFAPVPTVEANTSPLEGTANGIIVADASIPYIGIGLLEEPVRCKVEKGMIVSIEGGRQAQQLLDDLKSKNDPNVFNVAELGIGLNPNCRFIGFMLEDEGVYGSAHIGIGTSITLGGTVKAASHYDLIMHRATVEADGVVILKDGIVKV